MIQTILNMIQRQVMRANHMLQPMAELSDENPMPKKDLNLNIELFVADIKGKILFNNYKSNNLGQIFISC